MNCMNLGNLLSARAIEHPRKDAVIGPAGTLSYEALEESSTRLANWFITQGLQPGERIAIHWSNSPTAVQLYFALFKAGLIAVAVNTRLKSLEIESILARSKARMCFTEPALSLEVERAGAACQVFSRLPELGATEGTPKLPAVDPDFPAVIFYTSGTTALPKGATHTHRSLLRSAQLLAGDIWLATDIGLPLTPLMHAAALNGLLIPLIYLGATTLLVPGFNPAEILNSIHKFQCTAILSVPTLMQFLTQERMRSEYRTGSLRAAMVGGDCVSLALQDSFSALFGLPIQEGYGMTETLPITMNLRGSMRPGSMGTLADGVEVRIVDSAGKDVAEGDAGEVLVRSEANCIGYWDDPETTANVFQDGWLRTGDLAARDADGYYWFKGRKKEIIVRAGSNISPQEVEGALLQHPSVLEAGVVGEPDEIYGEQVIAFVALRANMNADETSLREFARQRLADYKVPMRIMFLDTLPKGLTGKVQRRALKEQHLGVPS
jgi:long-chain acyl-CoA synthetase